MTSVAIKLLSGEIYRGSLVSGNVVIGDHMVPIDSIKSIGVFDSRFDKGIIGTCELKDGTKLRIVGLRKTRLFSGEIVREMNLSGQLSIMVESLGQAVSINVASIIKLDSEHLHYFT